MASTVCLLHHHAFTATATRLSSSSSHRQVSNNIKPSQLVCLSQKQAAALEEDNSTVVSRRLAVTVLTATAAAIGTKIAPAVAVPGGWTPIQNLKDPHVQGIAQFAVDEYNKQESADLKLENVFKGETQVVAGTNYRLDLTAKLKSGGSNNFQAVVYERPWESIRELTSFEPLLKT